MMNSTQCLSLLALSLLLISEVSAIRSSLRPAEVFTMKHRAGRRLSAACDTCSLALKSAIKFGILGSAEVTNQGATTVTGNCGVSPGTFIGGFTPLGEGKCTGNYSRADDVSGQARLDARNAYNKFGTMTGKDLTGQDLANQTLTPGVYSFSSGGPLNGILTLDAQMMPNATFVIKTVSTFIMGANSSVVLANGAQACNVFFLVGSSSTVGPNSTMNGNIIAYNSVDVGFNSNVTGSIIALEAAVTLNTNNIAAQSTCPAAPAGETNNRRRLLS